MQLRLSRRIVVTLAVVSILAILAGLYMLRKVILNNPNPKYVDSETDFDSVMINRASNANGLFHLVKKVELKGTTFSYIKKFSILPSDEIVVLSSSVSLFDSSGNFLRPIGRIGGGPGEYVRPMDMAADSACNIYVLDTSHWRIVVFDTAGIFKFDFPLKALADQLVIGHDRVFTYTPASMYQSLMATCYSAKNGKELFQFAPPTKFLGEFKKNNVPSVFGVTGYLSWQGNDLYMIHPFEYTIREFDYQGREIHDFQGESGSFVPVDPHKTFSMTGVPADFYPTLLMRVLAWRGLIFVVIQNIRSMKFYLDIYTAFGKKLNTSSLSFEGFQPNLMSLTVDGKDKFYCTYQPEPKDLSKIPNPEILVYHFTPLTEKKPIDFNK